MDTAATEQSPNLEDVQRNLSQSLGRLSDFWGFGKVIGMIYGWLYLSPKPLSLDDLVNELGVSKGSVSMNIRELERLGMVRPCIRPGERKDYYEAEIDFWKIIRTILREREKRAFDRALESVSEGLAEVEQSNDPDAEFYRRRLKHMHDYFGNIDRLAESVLALERLQIGTLGKLTREATRLISENDPSGHKPTR